MQKFFQVIGVLWMSTSCLFSQSTESYIAVERYSKRVLIAANTEQVVPLGQLSQLATLKIALDWSKLAKVKLATEVIVPYGMDGLANPLRLQPGDRISLRDLMYSVSMANDDFSATVLAHYVGESLLAKRGKSGDSVRVFVAEMNALASSLNMTKTRFTSPHGVALPGLREGETTVTDLAKLAVALVGTHGLEFYTKQKSRSLTLFRASGERQMLTVLNQNKLIGEVGIKGMKVSQNQGILSANRKPFRRKLADGQFEVTPVQMIAISVYSNNRDGRLLQLVTQGWLQYEFWRESGYVASQDRKEFLH